MTTPVLPERVYEGGSYWAGMGETKWGAITLTSKMRKSGIADRNDAKTNSVKKRGAKVRIDRLVKRNPGLNGGDKPQIAPAKVFQEVVKKTRVVVEEVVEEVIEEPSAPIVKRARATPEEQEENWIRAMISSNGGSKPKWKKQWDAMELDW